MVHLFCCIFLYVVLNNFRNPRQNLLLAGHQPLLEAVLLIFPVGKCLLAPSGPVPAAEHNGAVFHNTCKNDDCEIHPLSGNEAVDRRLYGHAVRAELLRGPGDDLGNGSYGARRRPGTILFCKG